MGDLTQQEAIQTMVKTFGQMPQQLFNEPHLLRSKPTVRTTLLIRFGSAIKKLTSLSSNAKPTNIFVQQCLKLVKPKVSIDCEFIGKVDPLIHKPVHTINVAVSPERIVPLVNGELAVTEYQMAFFPSSSQTHNSLLVTWGHWDNALVVRPAFIDAPPIRLHHPMLNKVLYEGGREGEGEGEREREREREEGERDCSVSVYFVDQVLPVCVQWSGVGEWGQWRYRVLLGAD